jgi:hypothetical protein
MTALEQVVRCSIVVSLIKYLVMMFGVIISSIGVFHTDLYNFYRASTPIRVSESVSTITGTPITSQTSMQRGKSEVRPPGLEL